LKKKKDIDTTQVGRLGALAGGLATLTIVVFEGDGLSHILPIADAGCRDAGLSTRNDGPAYHTPGYGKASEEVPTILGGETGGGEANWSADRFVDDSLQ
jgi:hypothetical protein